MKLTTYFILFILLICTANQLVAQNNELQETALYYYNNEPNEILDIDTNIVNLEHYDYMQTDGWEYFNIGNIGTAHRFLAYNSIQNMGFQSGFSHFDRYKFSIDRIKKYNVEKPMSEIGYIIGSNRENLFHGKLAQNINNQLEIGVDFHRIFSAGTYTDQQTRDGAFELYTTFHSKNNRYHLTTELTFAKIKVQENGGLVEDILSDTVANVIDPTLFEVNLAEALTEHKNFDVVFTQEYDFGFHKIDSLNDSLAIRRFYPTFTIAHSFGTSKNTFSFIDIVSDSLDYGNFFQSSDSTYYRMYYHEIPNRIELKYSGVVNGDSVKYRNIQGAIGIQHDNLEIWQNREEFTSNNLHIVGRLLSNMKSKSNFQYDFHGQYYFAGYNRNDLLLRGEFGYDFNKFGNVSLSASYQSIAPSFIEQNYFSSTFDYVNSFEKKKTTQFSAHYRLPKHKFAINYEFNVLNNFIFFQNNGTPFQYNESFTYWKLDIRKNFKFKIFHLDNFIGVQKSSYENLRLPTLFLKSSFYVSGYIFKRNMLGSIGFDVRYNTNFQADAWNPLVGQFTIQNEREMIYTPVVDFFINFKVKTLRIFIKSNYVTQGLGRKNYYTALGYPTRGRTFTGGLVWRFLE